MSNVYSVSTARLRRGSTWLRIRGPCVERTMGPERKKNKTEFRFRVAPLQIFLSDMAGSYFGVPIERVPSLTRPAYTITI